MVSEMTMKVTMMLTMMVVGTMKMAVTMMVVVMLMATTLKTALDTTLRLEVVAQEHSSDAIYMPLVGQTMSATGVDQKRERHSSCLGLQPIRQSGEPLYAERSVQ